MAASSSSTVAKLPLSPPSLPLAGCCVVAPEEQRARFNPFGSPLALVHWNNRDRNELGSRSDACSSSSSSALPHDSLYYLVRLVYDTTSAKMASPNHDENPNNVTCYFRPSVSLHFSCDDSPTTATTASVDGATAAVESSILSSRLISARYPLTSLRRPLEERTTRVNNDTADVHCVTLHLDHSLGHSHDDDDGNVTSIVSPLSLSAPDATQSSFSNAPTSCWLAVLEQKRAVLPVVAVALSYNDNSVEEPVALSILLQSCLKRQLVGCHLLSRQGDRIRVDATSMTTRIHVSLEGQSWTLTVDSMSLQQSTSTPLSTTTTTLQRRLLQDSPVFVVGVILPSTRITLVPTTTTTTTCPSSTKASPPTQYPAAQNLPLQPGEQQQESRNTATLSPTARILVDTLTCMQRIQTPLTRTNSSSGRTSTSSRMDIPRAFLLSGPPGVGKTHAVRMAVAAVQQKRAAAAADKACHLVAIQGSELLGIAHHPGEAAQELERIWKAAVAQTTMLVQPRRGDQSSDTSGRSAVAAAAPRVAVIFLDECDALFSAPNGDESSSSTASLLVATVARLLDRMNSDPLWKRILVVAATNRVDSLPASLRRPGRLDREIPLAPPNAAQRLELLTVLLDNAQSPTALPDPRTSSLLPQNSTETFNAASNDNDAILEIADATVGYVAADLAALVRRAWLLRMLQPTDNISLTDSLKRAMVDVGASALRDAALQQAPVSSSSLKSSALSPWDLIAGDPGGAKTALRQAIEWPRTKQRAYQQLGLTPPRGILLHGPPGCAKTTLARAAAAASSGVAFLSLSPADVYASSYVGEAEGVVRRSFTLARSAAPCVLFFDEIDSILGSEDNNDFGGLGRSTSTSAEARVLSTFLNEMDGVDGSLKDGVLVLGATNRPGTLDAALLRPGRFDKIIYVPPPDFEGRRSILSMQCKNWPSGNRIDVDRLADDSMTGDMTGAEIVGACREAALRWLRDVPPLPFPPKSLTESETSSPPLFVDTSGRLEACLVAAIREVKPLLSDPDVLAEYTAFDERRRQ